ncbi:MAG: DNA polymerase III subunit alpha [Thermoanaerobaculales bacterium]|jgi:DNA polymerase-3 subunit alpha|nr:DNA polymerase III subunit alpha [Thermoanaerobaculales bacterium]
MAPPGDGGFVHLHVHTHYSLLDSTISIPELVRQASQLGMPALAITDHGNLFGAFQFHRAALEAGLRPVIGCEVYVAPGDHRDRTPVSGQRKPYDHLVLLAENDSGYRNLVRLVSEGFLSGFYHKPRISRELLAEHAEGLIGLSACLSGEVARRLLDRDPRGARAAAETYREILGRDSFFLELQNHGLADEEFVRQGVAEISRLTGIEMAATNDCHFHRREDLFAHRVLLGIGLNRTLEELHRNASYNAEFYVKSGEEMAALFVDFPGVCERTTEIASRCHVRFDTDRLHLPNYPVPEGSSIEAFLEQKAREGLERRLEKGRARRHDRQDYFSRLEDELAIIRRMGFPGYFLVVWDFIRYAKERNIPVGPGRGSAAGSVVSYALGVTDIDPLEYDLLFERFLNPERISMPDIDIDFCQRRRDEVIAYVRDLYGQESVSQIATFNILKAKSAVRDVGRVMGMPFGDVDRIAKLIPDDLNITIEKALDESPQLRELVEGDEDVRTLVTTAARLEGKARHCGVHAAGVVIAPEPLVNLVPLTRTSHGDVATQFDKDDVETLGLLKMDFLGLRTLTVLADAVESIRQSEDPAFELEGLALDDPAVYELFSAGDTDGVFQFESSGMKDVLRKVQPRVFLDLAALNALYRPGPMQFIDDYSDRKHGRRAISYIFPELEAILGETYGIIVYQEQVMRIAVEIAGFSMAKADTLRKAMGKKKQEIIDREGQSFIDGAIAKGFPKAKVRELWNQIVPFAKYGFNKSHSVAYAQVAYLTAYLKAHYPAHFMSAMLTSEASNTDKLRQYLARSRQMGLAILPPDVNTSLSSFSVEGGGIRFGLGAVKGVGDSVVEPLLEARRACGAFESLSHCLGSLPPRAINQKALECLVKAGCFDLFGAPRKGILDNLDRLLEMTSREREQRELGQGFLFADLPSESLEEEIRGADRATPQERLEWEREVLGFYLSGHPLDGYREQLERWADSSIADLPRRFADGAENATVGGLVSGLKVIPIKKEGRNQGRRMAVFQLEDATGAVRAVAFPDAFESCERLIADGRPVLVAATLKGEGEHVELMVEKVSDLDAMDSARAAALKIVLDLDAVDEERLESIREYLLGHPGDMPVRFELRRSGRFRARLVPPPALSIEASPEVREGLAALLAGGWCEFEFDTTTRNGRGDHPPPPADAMASTETGLVN